MTVFTETFDAFVQKNKENKNKVSQLLSARLYYTQNPMDRVPSGEPVMINIEGALGLDECVCVCVSVNKMHKIPKAKGPQA